MYKPYILTYIFHKLQKTVDILKVHFEGAFHKYLVKTTNTSKFGHSGRLTGRLIRNNLPFDLKFNK